MPRKKAKPTRIIKLDYGSAHTEKARYASREDRHFSFNLGGADDFRDGAFYLVGVIDVHRGFHLALNAWVCRHSANRDTDL